jgi:hypothetical protein
MKKSKLVFNFQKDSEKSTYISYDTTVCEYFHSKGKIGLEIIKKDLDEWFLSFAKNNNPFMPFMPSENKDFDSLKLIRMCAEKKKKGFRVFISEG